MSGTIIASPVFIGLKCIGMELDSEVMHAYLVHVISTSAMIILQLFSIEVGVSLQNVFPFSLHAPLSISRAMTSSCNVPFC